MALHGTLTSTIRDLKQLIAAGSFRSEAEISQGVVKRLLNELEWPVFDVQVVAPEFKIGTRKVDYALCHPPGKPSVLLEVKDLGKADGKGEKQLFEYCFHQGVPIAILTDGRTWSFFFPAGQGSYEERRFARVDLIGDDPGDSAKTLADYLQAGDVKSGEAWKRAQRDYEAARLEKEASSTYASVWRKLLLGPESLLLDLFSEEVEQATGVRPDRTRAAEFIRAQAGMAAGSPGQSRKGRKEKERESGGEGRPSFTFRGQTETFKSGAAVMGAVFGKLASEDPEFCARFSEQHYGRVRKYVANTKALLYPGNPEREKYSLPLPDGWWLATHCSNSAKMRRIKEACQVAGLEFERDLIVSIPVGSRKTKERPGKLNQ